MKTRRLAILGSHPIPYRAPLYRKLAATRGLEILVLYGDDYGVRPRWSAWGVSNFVWKAGVVDGYPHVFLRNVSPRPDPSTRTGKLNPGLVPALHRFKPDAVLVSGYSGIYAQQGIAGSRALRIPILYTSDTNVVGDPRGVKGWLKHLAIEPLYRRFEAFLTTGEQNRAHYRAFGVPDHKMFRFPWSVDNAHFRAEADRLKPRRAMLRAQWSVSDDAICVVYAGRLAPEKNVDELIRAVARAPRLHLLVVGSGPEEQRLRTLARSLVPGRCTFAGFLNQDRLGEAYAAADVFALPSRYEPWGLTCNEAMNFGLPIVASSRVGAAPDLVLEGRTGWQYPLGDVDALARALGSAVRALEADRPGVTDAVRAHIRSFDCHAQVEGVLAALDHAAR